MAAPFLYETIRLFEGFKTILFDGESLLAMRALHGGSVQIRNGYIAVTIRADAFSGSLQIVQRKPPKQKIAKQNEETKDKSEQEGEYHGGDSDNSNNQPNNSGCAVCTRIVKRCTPARKTGPYRRKGGQRVATMRASRGRIRYLLSAFRAAYERHTISPFGFISRGSFAGLQPCRGSGCGSAPPRYRSASDRRGSRG